MICKKQICRRIEVKIYEQIRDSSKFDSLQAETQFQEIFTCYAEVKHLNPTLIYNGQDTMLNEFTHKLRVRYNKDFLREQLYVEINGWRGEIKKVINLKENNIDLIIYVRRLDDNN